jgi:hypothetical protein
MEKLNNIIDSGEYEKIEGWCTKEKAYKMASLISSNDLCVELGVWGGRSLLPICFMTDNKVYGIDAWMKDASLEGTNDEANNEWWSKINYEDMYNYTKKILLKYNCNNARLYRSRSRDVVNFFQDETIDFLHQDSNHSEEISCEEVELYHKKIKKDGIWVFDDTNWNTTIKAQNLLLSYGFIEIYDSGEWKIYKKIL